MDQVIKPSNKKFDVLSSSFVDPDTYPVESEIICRIRIRNY